CINKDGTMNELAGKYEGMKLEEARKAIIEDLKREGLLIKQEDLKQTVGCCWRCETPVEFLPTEQWFIRTLAHKEKMIELGRKIKWYPEYYRKRYEDWVRNLKWDWCISRQRYYGVPFPVWYCKDCGRIVVAKEEDLPVDPRLEGYRCECGSENLEPEEDVMDTWMTSSLTPQITTKWVEDREFFEKMFPMSLRPQAHDIIRTWAFYTILKAYLHENSIPWENIMISGYVYVDKGMAMSSSKGIGESPEKVIERDGADVLRYWATCAGVGEDLIYREKDITRGKKIIIKLWNASRFAETHLKDYKREKAELKIEDKWILSELYRVIEEAESGYKNFNPNKAKRAIENFFKNVFCDFYLEMIKHRLYGNDEESKKAAKFTLYQCLLAILKMYAPIIPFITEEIYQELFREHEGDISIHVSKWPEKGEVDEKSLKLGRMATEIISAIRQWKTQRSMPMSAEVEKVVIESKEDLKEIEEVVKGTMKVKEIEYGKVSEGTDIGFAKVEIR
ncbi:MAG TPA: valine--tRNA ligase, partial [Candidatus Aenigmarchaeota archaeon]|nr:valine--tRNA ligase [Candidatus Aenigmarchaeota archaeon]